MNLTFENVKNLSSAELCSLPKKKIVDCILKYAALNDEIDHCYVFGFAFSQFAKTLSLNDINILICEQVLTILTDSFDDVIACAESGREDLPIEEVIKQVQTVFQLYKNLLDTIHQMIDNEFFALSNVGNTLLNTLHFLKTATSHDFLYKENEVKTLLEVMQMSITKILASEKFQLSESPDELKLCSKVLHALVELGHLQSVRINVKSMANTWKHLSKLAVDFRSVYHQLAHHHTIEFDAVDFFDWLTFCIQNICQLVTNNVKKLQAMVGNRQFTAIEKITQFYQKLLLSLTDVYKNNEFRGQSDFIQSYETIIDALDKCVDDNFRTVLMSLSDGFGKALYNVYDCDCFSTKLLLNSRTHHIRVHLEIAKLLLSSPIPSKEWYLNHVIMQKNIFNHLLAVNIPKEMNRAFTSIELHDEVVAVCSGLMLACSEDQEINDSLHNILVEATLTDDPHRVPFLLDIWYHLLGNLSNESQFLYCKYWLSLNQNTSPLLRTPANLLIKKLLKYTLSLLSEDQQSQIVREMTEHDVSSLAVLGFDSVTNGEVKRFQQFSQKNVTKMKEILAKLNPNSEIVSANECLELMSALACFQSPATRHSLSLLSDAELINCSTDALFRCKTRPVNVLLATILRMLLWSKNFCGKPIEIDYSDSSDVKQSYANELIILAKRCPGRMFADANLVYKDVDDLTRARMRNVLPRIESNTHTEHEMDCSEDEHLNYIHHGLNIIRPFGCSTFESCSNPKAFLKRTFEQIILDAKS